MNSEDFKRKVREAAYEILKNQVFIAPVDLLMKMEVLTRKDYEDWRMGRIPYLEKVCNKSLSKMKVIMDELGSYAHRNNLKESWTAYHKWGKGKKIVLRFSKSGSPQVEKAYSTHFVDEARAKKIREAVSEVESSNRN
jgi:hypothetical protein